MHTKLVLSKSYLHFNSILILEKILTEKFKNFLCDLIECLQRTKKAKRIGMGNCKIERTPWRALSN